MTRTILVVDDRGAPRRALANELSDAGFRVVQAADGLEGFACFEREAPDLVLSDLAMPRCDGLELVGRIRAASAVPIVLFTSQGGVRDAVAAVKCGADDFVASQDLEIEELVALAESHAGTGVRPAEELARSLPGNSPSITRARDRLEALAPLGAPVLLTGEPGTGRAAAARALHRLGRARRPFQRVEASGLVEWPRPARHATVYVEGIDDLAPALQESWLRLLDAPGSGERWVASGGPGAADPGGPLHPELRARLARFCVALPPLRERPEDVPRVAREFARAASERFGRPRRLGPAALERLRAAPWPGNATELAQVVEQAIAFSTSAEIDVTTVNDVLAEVRWSV